MNLGVSHICPSTLEYQEYKIPSASQMGSFHTVTVGDPFDPSGEGSICDCLGFDFRGTCRHIDEVMGSLCLWSETSTGVPPVNGRCPFCGKPAQKITVINE